MGSTLGLCRTIGPQPPTLGRIVQGGLLLIALCATSACQTYRPAPPSLLAYPNAVDARTLDDRPSGALWTTADLITAAVSRNPQIAEAAAKYRTAVAAAKTAKVAPAATLTLTAEYSKDAGGSSPWLYGASSDIPLDYGVRRSGRLGQADLAVIQARYDYAETVWAVRQALVRTLSDRAAADADTPITAALVQDRQARAVAMDRRVAAGEDQRSVALTAQIELAAAQRRERDTGARRAQADIALAKALGVSAAQVKSLKIAAPQTPPSTAVTGQMRHQAALTRRDVLKAVNDYDLAELALRGEIAKQYPELRIGPGYTWERGVRKLPFNLTLGLPPYDLNRAAIAQAEAKRAEAGSSLEAVQAGVLAAVDQAQAVLAAAQDAEATIRARDLRLAQRQSQDQALSRRMGETDSLDQRAAHAAALDSELAAHDAAHAVRMAVADLEDALRLPFDPAEVRPLQIALKRLGGGS